MSTKTCTTGQAAKEVGISRATLQAWIGAGKVRAPKLQLLKRVAARLWSQSDVSRLRKVKEQVYRRGRGRKKKV